MVSSVCTTSFFKQQRAIWNTGCVVAILCAGTDCSLLLWQQIQGGLEPQLRSLAPWSLIKPRPKQLQYNSSLLILHFKKPPTNCSWKAAVAAEPSPGAEDLAPGLTMPVPGSACEGSCGPIPSGRTSQVQEWGIQNLMSALTWSYCLSKQTSAKPTANRNISKLFANSSERGGFKTRMHFPCKIPCKIPNSTPWSWKAKLTPRTSITLVDAGSKHKGKQGKLHSHFISSDKNVLKL